jgi:hypothetical protein
VNEGSEGQLVDPAVVLDDEVSLVVTGDVVVVTGSAVVAVTGSPTHAPISTRSVEARARICQ